MIIPTFVHPSIVIDIMLMIVHFESEPIDHMLYSFDSFIRVKMMSDLRRQHLRHHRAQAGQAMTGDIGVIEAGVEEE